MKEIAASFFVFKDVPVDRFVADRDIALEISAWE
jgi:hypothetical protein